MVVSIPDKNDFQGHALRSVNYDKGFHFFYGSGANAGETVTSLATFTSALKTIDIRSINYHLSRKDFQKWIGTVIGDEELAKRIDDIEWQGSDENLRARIVEVLEKRLTELSSQAR